MRVALGTALALLFGVGCGARATTVSSPGEFPRDPAPPVDVHDSAVPNEVTEMDVPAAAPRLRRVVTLGSAEFEPMYGEPYAPSPNQTNVNITINEAGYNNGYGYGGYGYGGYGAGTYGRAGSRAFNNAARGTSSQVYTRGFNAPANGPSTYVPRGGHVGTIEGPIYTGQGGSPSGSSFNRGTTSAPTRVGGNWPAVHDAGPRAK